MIRKVVIQDFVDKVVYLAIGSEEDYFEFGVKLSWLLDVCKTQDDVKFETNVELEFLFKGNWELSQRIFDIGVQENQIIH